MPRKLLVGGAQRSGSVKGLTVKKVAPPVAPALHAQTTNHKRSNSIPSNPCVCRSDQLGEVTPDYEESDNYTFRRQTDSPSSVRSTYGSVYGSHPSIMKKMNPIPGAGSNGQIHFAHVIVHSQPESLPTTPVEPLQTPSLIKGRMMSSTQVSLEDQGIDVMSSPGRHSPGGSSGGSSISRHSLSSLDSGRASAPSSDGKVINRRLSVHSYGDSSSAGSPQRRSYHSSSSSISSSAEDQGSNLGHGPNVAEMVLHGLPDVEILCSWLASLHFEEYASLFLQAGYDMPTITRMTPEDLTAIGVTKPNHRRKMKAEIAKLNISDGIPEYKPDTLLEWLQILRLGEYYSTLCEQHYDTIDKVTEITWEDLEDIGIQKLGHQKKILLAIKRIEDINQGRRPNLVPQMKKMQSIAEQQPSNCLGYQRPSTLSSVQPYIYPAQEIAIAMHRPKNSPSTDSIPELKTFQQSPIREENSYPTLLANTTPRYVNGNVNPVLSPCRGRSLESLHPDDITPTVVRQLDIQAPPVVTYPAPSNPVVDHQPKVPVSKDWKTTDLDSDYNYECEGTATLNRPKGLVKLRPVAKITAKTREEIAEIITDIPDKEFKSLISQNRSLDGWSSLDGSPRHGPSATVTRASTLTRRPPPPPPPKRTNSAKSDTKRENGPIIKQKPLILPRALPQEPKKEKPEDPPPPPPPPQPTAVPAEEFPPPPSPLPSAVEGEKSGQMEELFSNPLFRQKRKDSADSSIDSSALPFANEAVATLKQKASRPYPLSDQSSLENNRYEGHQYDVTPEAMSPGDVIDDIEHMLANLSDQLDAMLDEEQVQN